MTQTAAPGSKLVLVTGAGGFLGRHVCAALGAAGFTVRRLMGPPAEAPSSPTFCASAGDIWADICEQAAVRHAVKQVDVVVHLAGPPSVAASFRDPASYARAHVEGTAVVLEACWQSPTPPRIVAISSAEVYGRPDTQFVKEDHPLRPRSPYAAAKAGAEAMVAAYTASCGLSTVVLRPFSIYGPGMSSHTLLSEVARKALSGEPVVVHDLTPVRDYCYVEDFASAVVCACSAPCHGSLTCNIGSMQGTSVADLCRLWLGALGSSSNAHEDPAGKRPGASEIYRLVADNRLAREALGWSPAFPLEKGLQMTARALRS